MQNGDISNESSPRIIVLIDVVVKSEIVDKKLLGLTTGQERRVTGLDHIALSHLWNMSNKYGLSVELAAFSNEDWSQEDLDKFMDKLERRGGNPFNYAELYSDIDDFIGELPYRTNLKGVIDLPGRVARYGSMGVELMNL